MTMRVRLVAMGAVMAALAGVPLAAQEPGAGKPAEKAVRKGGDPARRVPPGYGQIGLTPEQREKIYGIRAKHMEKITALEKELDTLRKKMDDECETVLTDSQKKILTERRAAMRDRARPDEDSPAPPAASKKAAP
jgi:Spy/CpxP family protein refolding chaperone